MMVMMVRKVMMVMKVMMMGCDDEGDDDGDDDGVEGDDDSDEGDDGAGMTMKEVMIAMTMVGTAMIYLLERGTVQIT